jgi:metal-dependent amidase/aminoacylase/carboxypeptidase family protein
MSRRFVSSFLLMRAIKPHHHPKFDVDERSMLNIGKLFIGIVLDYLAVE